MIENICARYQSVEHITVHHCGIRLGMQDRHQVLQLEILAHAYERGLHCITDGGVHQLRAFEYMTDDVVFGQDADQAVVFHHRKLGESGVAQTVVRSSQNIGRADRYRGPLIVRAPNQVAQVAMLLALLLFEDRDLA